MAMIILTVPIIFPVITQLGFDPIWFGVIIVMTVELGLIHPPVGMNVFVIKSVVEDVKLLHDLLWRAAVHRHRHPPADHPDRLPDPRAVAAVEDVKVIRHSLPGSSPLAPERADGWIPGTGTARGQATPV